MNTAHLLSAATLALAAGSAFAYDDVQRFPAPSEHTRAEVRSEINAPAAMRQIGEVTVFVDNSDEANRSRAAVRAEARQAARQDDFNPLYVGA